MLSFPHAGWFPLDSFMWEAVCWQLEHMVQIHPVLPSDSDGHTGLVDDFSDLCWWWNLSKRCLKSFVGIYFLKASGFLCNILVDLQFSQLYVSAENMFELKFLSFVLLLYIFHFHTLLSLVDAFPILGVTSFLRSPMANMVLPRQVNCSTSVTFLASSVIYCLISGFQRCSFWHDWFWALLGITDFANLSVAQSHQQRLDIVGICDLFKLYHCSCC